MIFLVIADDSSGVHVTYYIIFKDLQSPLINVIEANYSELHFILWFVWSWSLLQFIFSFAPNSNISHSDVSARSRFTRTGNDDVNNIACWASSFKIHQWLITDQLRFGRLQVSWRSKKFLFFFHDYTSFLDWRL